MARTIFATQNPYILRHIAPILSGLCLLCWPRRNLRLLAYRRRITACWNPVIILGKRKAAYSGYRGGYSVYTKTVKPITTADDWLFYLKMLLNQGSYII